MTAPVRFTGAGVWRGARACMPLVLGILPFAVVVGMAAQAQGLSVLEITLMSALVYAGSAQLVVLGHWADPAPVIEAALAALVVNLRMALMGPVLAPWLDRLRGWRLWGSLFLLADNNWALSVSHMQRGEADAGFLFGSGLAMWAAWVAASAAGHALAGLLHPAPGHPLFFAALAVFLSILVTLWRGRGDLLPWCAAAGVAVAVSRLLPGTWYIVAGALAGSLAAALRDRARGGR